MVDNASIIENTSYSTPAKLIAPGLLVPGTLSITSNDLYFDADEDDPVYREQDIRVSLVVSCGTGSTVSCKILLNISKDNNNTRIVL